MFYVYPYNVNRNVSVCLFLFDVLNSKPPTELLNTFNHGLKNFGSNIRSKVVFSKKICVKGQVMLLYC